ncbi:MAG: periplasmic Cu(I)/Cu(II)-binding protein CopK [Aromatoleum sp.]|jgi:hypothetical protein|uniref:periplasmic Cu(I)/Cu(II)-binding protein CopK n=1 Tax=Aromatoleum sp. TaxID=2307007 RepID=UPI00289578B8|nr:periplasmic Cu(I)/Cu(II)-binding protein CopK [Aromatoleum sp.]MDT3670590.1 periplasmic Cu(I)/Cu(II)-binding protein CopK [Aromatoleum sp.]
MLKQLIIGAAAAIIATGALAVDKEKVEKSYELKDGSTLYIFKDGKMGMEDKGGRAQSMKDGQVMETKDGEKIMMKGNEIWRVEKRHEIHRGG